MHELQHTALVQFIKNMSDNVHCLKDIDVNDDSGTRSTPVFRRFYFRDYSGGSVKRE